MIRDAQLVPEVNKFIDAGHELVRAIVKVGDVDNGKIMKVLAVVTMLPKERIDATTIVNEPEIKATTEMNMLNELLLKNRIFRRRMLTGYLKNLTPTNLNFQRSLP